MKKHMKILFTVVAVLLIGGLMASCDNTDKKDALVMKISGDGMEVVMHLDSKGDTITHMSQTITMDLTKTTPENAEKIRKGCEEYKKKYSKYDFAQYSYKEEDNKLIQTVSTDTGPKEVKELRKAKLLPVSSDTDKLGVKATKKMLESRGFKVVEE